MSHHHPELGKLVGEDSSRDAIHIAVAPVTCAKKFKPGQHVAVERSVAVEPSQYTPAVGIIDPFLKNDVYPDERCWVLLFPNTITDLRHHWTHPEFEAEEDFDPEHNPDPEVEEYDGCANC